MNRTCPSGDDPGIATGHNEVNVQVNANEVFHFFCVCAFVCMHLLALIMAFISQKVQTLTCLGSSGSLLLSFRGQATSALNAGATPIDLKVALEVYDDADYYYLADTLT